MIILPLVAPLPFYQPLLKTALKIQALFFQLQPLVKTTQTRALFHQLQALVKGPISSTPSSANNWIVEDGNVTCIILTMEASFSIKYNKTDHKTIGTGKLFLPQNASVDVKTSTCSGKNGTQIIVLIFNNNSFMMTFTKDDKQVLVTEMKLNYILDNSTFPDVSELDQQKNVSVSGEFFKVDVGKNYLCKKADEIQFNTNVMMTVSNLQLESFRTDNNTVFTSDSWECDADNQVSDIVPIAVGCALAGMVVIVLIAYLVGRHRNRQKGYQSV
ncbi:lysosome-associated membrane glycoprotein 1-like [Limulus polyphemus]|uniref:Lysosome-associated membrane glycoprotein 5 n=1 Tax=Limulus polyphemus TaxID=6850 RepID=A0ABM1C594_LIMPO|nr:lysosome-associated membrane glycoprotein 1-like [Limulus polyphemus]